MRYSEIIEDAATAERVWKATKATHNALRTYRKKEDGAAKSLKAANGMKPSPTKGQRTQGALTKAREAQTSYSTALSRANQQRTDALRSAGTQP